MDRFVLQYQTHSPFARKVLVFAHEAGLADRLEVRHQETSPTLRNDDVFALNPLGKVPVLVRPGRSPLFDSTVICAFLDTLHDGKPLIPRDGEARWRALRLQALADGLAESGIAVRWETERRPEALRYPPLRDGHLAKIDAGYAFAAREIEQGPVIDIGCIALATALSWLEFRAVAPLGDKHPELERWLAGFNRRPSMLATPLEGDTVDG
jgi:glutathione S-transferase